MTTSTQLHFKENKIIPEVQDKVLKGNLRASHFQMGQHPQIFDSANTNYGAFKQPSTGTQVDHDTKNRLRNSSFDLGNKDLNGAFFNTTYKLYNGPKNIKEAQPIAKGNTNSFESSITLGGPNN